VYNKNITLITLLERSLVLHTKILAYELNKNEISLRIKT